MDRDEITGPPTEPIPKKLQKKLKSNKEKKILG